MPSGRLGIYRDGASLMYRYDNTDYNLVEGIGTDSRYVQTTGDELTGQITLSGSGKTVVRLRPVLDQGRIVGVNKPTIVYRGITRGYSLPVYNSDNEELFFCEPYVPARWDGTTNPSIIIEGYLDTANANKKFKLQTSWTINTPGTDVLGATTVADPTKEITTGVWLQYQTFTTTIDIDYDAGTPDVMLIGDCLNFRLYRVAASDNEIAGEVVITGVAIKWTMDKFYQGA